MMTSSFVPESVKAVTFAEKEEESTLSRNDTAAQVVTDELFIAS
jgi:hypothetical protein